MQSKIIQQKDIIKECDEKITVLTDETIKVNTKL